MLSLKPKAPKLGTRKSAPMHIAAIIRKGITENPDVRTVLEIALRARELESAQPPRNIGIATDAVATSTNSQCPA